MQLGNNRLYSNLDSFSARLPDLCDSINRKLGGPVIKSPPKQKQQSKSASVKSKPGAPAKRAGLSAKKARGKTIEEVLSKEKMRRSVSRGPDAVALLRSASVAFVPTLKKENSEPVLSAIPKGEPASLRERPVNVFSRAYSTGAGDMRAKKKAQIEAELQDAISALKKPNRALAAKEITDAAERRVSTGSLKRMRPKLRSLEITTDRHCRT
jgi:DNA replication regulator SLD3